MQKPKTNINLKTIENTKQGHFVDFWFTDCRDNYALKAAQKYIRLELKRIYGDPGKRYNFRYTDHGMCVRFANEKDIAFFALKF